MTAAWPQANVVDAALRVSIQEIRKALNDNADLPRFIETVGKQGYRFIAPVSFEISSVYTGGTVLPFVGRATELEHLTDTLDVAQAGKRQVVFITGEPGIGKTTLVDVFTNRLFENDEILVARGQCIEQYGAGEAYLPILDALEQLYRAVDGQQTISLLGQLAPSWLLNLSAIISPEEREALARQCLGITAERRLREITTYLEEIARNRTIVLILEDLHWVDPSTLSLISFLARRREAARLMLIGTYRSGEVERRNLTLKTVAAELMLHHLCTCLPLQLLNREAVEEYLSARFENPAVSDPVVSAVYCRSEGNPLFMVNVTDYLIEHQAIVREKDSINLAGSGAQENVPSTIRDLIIRQFEALADQDRELLETASVAGVKFSVALLARILGRPREAVEKRCRELTEHEQFLQSAGSRIRPSGTSSSLYTFSHALYQNVIYDRIGWARRRRLHFEIGQHLEKVFAGGTEQIAAELALHFERAGDHQQGVYYLIQAAQKASQQSGYREAIDYSSFGLRLLPLLPDNRERTQMELQLQVTMSVSLGNTLGYTAAEVGEAYNRADQLCQKVEDDALRIQALNGLFSFYCMRGEPRHALDIGKQMNLAAQRLNDAASTAEGHTCAGLALFYLGEYAAAQEHFDQASTAYTIAESVLEKAAHPDYVAFSLNYTAVNLWLLGYRVINLWVLGYPDRANEEAKRAPFLRQQLTHPLILVANQVMLASYYQCRSESSNTLKLSDEGIKSATEYGISHWLTGAKMCKGWALANLGHLEQGMALLREGLNNWREIGAKTEAARFISLLAEACLLSKRTQEGLNLISEALKLSDETEDRFFQSEAFRIKGELLKKARSRKCSDWVEAESHFLRAIEIARRQKARSFELRATVSLARLWQKTGKEKEAKRILAKIYGWFTEGFDTPDLKLAKALLDELR